ncbi:MAG: hypothetical protein IJB08_05580, partial [Alistipes sp.]|nr:hypothetical protein [Alistipes sp.]
VGLDVRLDLIRRHPAKKRIVVDVDEDISVKLPDVHLHCIAVLAVFGEDALDVSAEIVLHRREHLYAKQLSHDPFLIWLELRTK